MLRSLVNELVNWLTYFEFNLPEDRSSWTEEDMKDWKAQLYLFDDLAPKLQLLSRPR